MKLRASAPSRRRRILRRAVALALVVGWVAPLALAAEQKSSREEKRQATEKEKTGRQHTISDQRTGKRLNAALELLRAEQFDEAIAALDAFNMDRLNAYERALIYQFKGHAYASLNRYEDASEAFRLCIEQDALPPQGQQQARFTLAQIYMMLEKYDEAVAQLEDWFARTEAPTPSAFYTMASAYYQAGREDAAVEPAEQAVFRSEEPRESWLQLLLALYLDRKRYEDALPLIEQLVTRFPKKAYWVQLAAVYFSLERDKESFAVQQLAYTQGLLTSDRELRRLAQMSLYNDLPYRAALILKKGLDEGVVESDKDAWQILGNSWLAAREYERAVPPLERAAALAEDGELWLRLAQVHVQREEWAPAIEAVDKALAKGLDKGGPNTPCHGHLLVGIARYNQKKLGPARDAIRRALRCEKTREMAERWIEFLDREEQRLMAQQMLSG